MIPVCEPVIGAREQEYVSQCLRSGWVSSAGEYIERFEEAWANRCGMAHGIAVSNGTTALQLAVDDLELEAGDEVILPTFTIISCALAVLRCHGVYNQTHRVFVRLFVLYACPLRKRKAWPWQIP